LILYYERRNKLEVVQIQDFVLLLKNTFFQRINHVCY
jgi:hypothetical protein